MMSILVPIAAVTIIGLICAVGLSVASALLAVKEDERFPAIRECLPGANCGGCGGFWPAGNSGRKCSASGRNWPD